MKKFDIRNPSRSLMILVILVISIGLGFFFDFLCICVEKVIYPKQYTAYVEASAAEYDIPPHVLYAVIDSESDFDASAVSDAGAVGLMQLMPDTFRWLTDEILFEHFEDGMMYDPETNVRYGACHLSRLYERYARWDLAFAAYNAGSTHVDEWLENPEYADGEGGLAEIPFDETRAYVRRIKKALDMYDRLYGKT